MFDWLNITLIKVGEYNLTTGALCASLVVIAATFIVAKLVSRAINRLALYRHPTVSHQIYTINKIVYYFLIVLGFIGALSVLGLQLDKLVIIGGALGIGIGLGLQSIVNNFVSGIIILLEKSIKVGDFLELDSGLMGEVKAIRLRSTLIRTNDNIDILVPSSEFISGRVINWTLEEDVRRFRIPFGVAYGSDKQKVKDAVLQAVNKISYTLDDDRHKPLVWMTGFGDSSLNFSLGVWVNPDAVKRPSQVTSDYLWAIDDALREAGIEIPFPQRDLHFRSSQIELTERTSDC
ncbi:mechanosensitive ion channel [Gilvimarinus agarilyticus]|uniref:mechanosensitive ion channel family protein n=1 Tax=unclassified Gilvimarinus TaxID=2642066 RepID=UPI001C099F8C|nr:MULTISPECIES: mechanosensitive ion channel domain-containing protein [unclassified Gilvimarinus]MBU2886646.1 mechanosensitive ion channel [Gilvimarinus agarilyticus]MDO6571314.1 mechanosensitive ion channel [Gilvimarinus sp. 2_MG-2023]MDO6746311.1 mechanosensitive ion channel [Gilvimarinus sp. 1_MG-2023]